jgi:hypothetical protein
LTSPGRKKKQQVTGFISIKFFARLSIFSIFLWGVAGSCLLGIHTSEISNCYPIKLAWQCVDIGGSQTVELVSQVLELDKSHGVDEETTCKEDSSLKNYIRKKKTKKVGGWLPLIEACAFYMFSVTLT